MLYPLFFNPVYKNIIWGGRNLEKLFKRDLPGGCIGESWEICCHKNGMSLVSNGFLKGKSLLELMKDYKVELLGSKFINNDRFPFLIKLLDANDRLSVQVHPDNDYGLRIEGEQGKTELWYIVDAKENAKLIYGTKPKVSKEQLKEAVLEGSLEDYLNFVQVKKGDLLFIPSGTVHAILEGIIIAEIQQNSDTTYRLYDWNRVDSSGVKRKLHIDKALDVINFDFKNEIKTPPQVTFNGYEIAELVHCDYFKVDKIKATSIYTDKTLGVSMHIYTSIEGAGTLSHNGINYPLPPGTTFLLPASIGEYSIAGDLTLLKTYM